MVRMPDALESSIQKATDLGALGIIVPTVDDALEARDAARFSVSPVGRRSARRLSRSGTCLVLNYRATINDNMLVTVMMIETLEGVAMANEIAATHGVDVIIILGNNDLASFSGWSQHDPRSGRDHQGPRCALKIRQMLWQRREKVPATAYGRADTRMVQNGPACDGWRPAGGGVAAPPGRRRS